MNRPLHVAAPFFLIALTGCIPIVAPFPVKQQTVSAKGTISNFDLKSVRAGVTRDQIDTLLADVGIDCGTPRIFWCRWNSSRWMLVYGVIAPGTGRSSGGDTRLGKVHNIVLEFDHSGKLVQRHDVNEGALLPALTAATRNASMPALNLDRPLILSARHWKHIDDPTALGSLTLTRSEIIFEESDSKHNFSTPASAVQSLSTGLQYETTAHRIAATVHLSRKTPAHRKLKLGVTPADLLTLIRWFQQVNEPSSQKSSQAASPA